jgi:hypothetical protein
MTKPMAFDSLLTASHSKVETTEPKGRTSQMSTTDDTTPPEHSAPASTEPVQTEEPGRSQAIPHTHYVTTPVAAVSSRGRTRLGWIVAGTAIVALCLGGVIGAGVTAAFTHHHRDGGRPNHGYFDDRRDGPRMGPPGQLRPGPFQQPGQPAPSGSASPTA